ncbi:MAG: glycosyltransferase family 4 protein [Planctomycetota bacterium]
MRLLFCIDRYHPSRGGAEAYLRDLCAALHARGHEISIAALEAEEDGNADLIRIPAPRFPRLAREIVFAVKVRRLKRRSSFDRTLGFRHVLDADLFQPHEGLFIDSMRGSLGPSSSRPFILKLLFLKKLLSLKNLFFLYTDWALFRNNPKLKVAALSCRMASAIEFRYACYQPRTTVIPNGVDIKKFYAEPDPGRREALRIRLALPLKGRLLLFVGHNFRLKGLIEAIRGVAEYGRQGKNALLIVVGRGKTKPYQRLIQRIGMEGRVFFLGEQAEMRGLYAASDLLLHPTYYDPCSLVVLEALGAGLPVITSRFNGAAELLQGTEAGCIIEDPRDTNALANALTEILDSGQYETFRKNAAMVGASNAFEQHVQRMESWIMGT